MARQIPLKLAVVAMLGGAALIGGSTDWFALGALLFGIFNATLSVHGTQWVRVPAIVVSLLALVAPDDARRGMLALLVIVTWLVWPPAFLAAWALARDEEPTAQVEGVDSSGAGRRARVTVAAIIAAVAVACFAFRLITGYGLQQSAALFVGIPALLAIVVTLTVSPRSATGVACKAVTVGLLVSLLFLGEGMLCVAMSAPLFYAVAIPIGRFMDRARREHSQGAHTSFSSLVLLALIPMSLEGVTEFTTVNRDESVAETRIVQASPAAVRRALFEPPRFDRPLPPFLRAGFPRPISTRIEEDAASTRWVIRVGGGEMRLNGMEPREGDLILHLVEERPGFVRWEAVADDSHMTHFLVWRDITVEWEPAGDHATAVTWTLRYRRRLDPAWYFGPWERYAARLAAGYLIDSVATP